MMLRKDLCLPRKKPQLRELWTLLLPAKSRELNLLASMKLRKVKVSVRISLGEYFDLIYVLGTTTIEEYNEQQVRKAHHGSNKLADDTNIFNNLESADV